MIETLNETGRVWANYFVWAIIQNTLFLGLVFLVLHWLRNAPANVRYAVAAVGLVKLLLPPFVPAQLLSRGVAGELNIPSTYLFSFTESAAVPATPATAPIRLDVLGILFILWAATALFILARSIILTARLTSAVKDAVPVTDDSALGIAEGHRIELYKSDRIGMPLTIGLIPHRIFVPTAWDEWTPECRDVVVKHEMAHIRRRDGLFQFLEIVVQALYFFHPLAMILNRRLREYREMACDDASVGGEQRSRIDYSKFLLELAETALHPPVACESASALMRKKNELLKRVAYQVKEGTMHRLSKKAIAVVLAALILAVVPFSFYHGGSTATGPDPANAGTQKSSDGKSDKHKFGQIAVTIKPDKILIDGKKTSLDQFTPAMQKLTKGEPGDYVVSIECAGDMSMVSLFEVQKQMIDIGLYKVAYDGNEGSEFPMVLPGKDFKERLDSIPQKLVVDLRVDASGAVFIDKQKVSPGHLTKTLERRIDENPNLIVSMYMDEKTLYDDFVRVLDSVKKSGVERIAINNPIS
jgi:beta-lactamase regulating signal transducer with metallopeptidase domain